MGEWVGGLSGEVGVAAAEVLAVMREYLRGQVGDCEREGFLEGVFNLKVNLEG